MLVTSDRLCICANEPQSMKQAGMKSLRTWSAVSVISLRGVVFGAGIEVGNQTLLDCDLLNGDGQATGIDDQPVNRYQPGQGTVGKPARQRPFVVELADAQSLSDKLCLVAAGARSDAKMSAQLGHGHVRRCRFITQEVDLPQRVKDGASPGLLISAGQRTRPFAAKRSDCGACQVRVLI